jgi:hypothetical protein
MGVAKVAQSVGTAEVAQSPASGHALSRDDVTLLKLLAQGLALEVVARRLAPPSGPSPGGSGASATASASERLFRRWSGRQGKASYERWADDGRGG